MKKKTKLLIRDAFLSTIFSCILFSILSIAFFNIRFFNPLHKAFADFSFLDVYYAESFHKKDQINNQIILVNIEDHDRAVIAELLKTVLDEKPKVVGFDIILEKHNKHTKTDSVLAKLLRHKKVVTSFNFIDNKIIKDDSFFKTKHKPGFININFDDNTAVIREFIGEKNILGKDHKSFATKIAKKYLKDSKWKKYDYDEKLKRTNFIKYVGNYKAFNVLSIDDFLFNDTKPILKDKIVILGYLGKPTGSKTDIEDKFFTPLNETLAGKSDADMFGAVIHANIVNMLINNDFIHKISLIWLGTIIFLCMFFSTMVYMKLNRNYKISYRTRKQVYQLIFSLVLFAIVLWLFKNGIALSPFPIIVGVLLAGSYFKYYKQLVRLIKTKRKWKTYVK